MGRARACLRRARLHRRAPRLRVRSEDKDAIAAFHWRGAPDEAAAAAAVREIAARAEQEGLAVHWGRKVLEVRPPVVLDKSLGVGALLSGDGFAFAAALYAGDDTTDLDAFVACARSCRPARWPRRMRRGPLQEAPRELIEPADLAIDGPTACASCSRPCSSTAACASPTSSRRPSCSARVPRPRWPPSPCSPPPTTPKLSLRCSPPAGGCSRR